MVRTPPNKITSAISTIVKETSAAIQSTAGMATSSGGILPTLSTIASTIYELTTSNTITQSISQIGNSIANTANPETTLTTVSQQITNALTNITNTNSEEEQGSSVNTVAIAVAAAMGAAAIGAIGAYVAYRRWNREENNQTNRDMAMVEMGRGQNPARQAATQATSFEGPRLVSARDEGRLPVALGQFNITKIEEKIDTNLNNLPDFNALSFPPPPPYDQERANYTSYTKTFADYYNIFKDRKLECQGLASQAYFAAYEFEKRGVRNETIERNLRDIHLYFDLLNEAINEGKVRNFKTVQIQEAIDKIFEIYDTPEPKPIEPLNPILDDVTLIAKVRQEAILQSVKLVKEENKYRLIKDFLNGLNNPTLMSDAEMENFKRLPLEQKVVHINTIIAAKSLQQARTTQHTSPYVTTTSHNGDEYAHLSTLDEVAPPLPSRSYGVVPTSESDSPPETITSPQVQRSAAVRHSETTV